MTRIDSNLSQQRWEACKSGAAEEIPAFAVVQVSGAEFASNLGSVSDEPLLVVGKPNVSDVPLMDGYSNVIESYSTRGHRIRFNGPVPIPVGGFGYVTRDVPTHVLCHIWSGFADLPTVADDRIFCPTAGQWYLSEVVEFAATNPAEDFAAVFQMAFVTPLLTNQDRCVVGYVTLQSRVRQS